MRVMQPQQWYELGMLASGVMGRNSLLDVPEHGHSVARYDKDATKVAVLRQETENRELPAAPDVKEFIALLRKPRAVTLHEPTGAPVDAVIKDLLACLNKGNLIILHTDYRPTCGILASLKLQQLEPHADTVATLA